MSSKITGSIAKVAKQSAITHTNIISRFFFHQPKVPTKLLEMKKSK